MEYLVAMHWQGTVYLTVEADSEEAAIAEAKQDVEIVNPLALENLELQSVEALESDYRISEVTLRT